jgi:site-specific recombinase XerD
MRDGTFNGLLMPATSGEACSHSRLSVSPAKWASEIFSLITLQPGRAREPFLQDACAKAGREPISRITRNSIELGMARRRPNVAKHFFYAMRGLFKWAVEAQHCEQNPTIGLKVAQVKTDGHPPWSAEWCDKFRTHWSIGTGERADFDLLFWTGLRVSDAVRVGRPHIKDGKLIIRAGKNHKRVPIPIAPELQTSLDAAPTSELTFLVGADGRPMTASAFSARVRRAARKAGVPGSAHGLRKTRATLLVEAGANEAELAAIMGWHGMQMAQLYTRSRNEELLAESAAEKLARTKGVDSIPAPSNKVRASGGNPQ